MGASHNMERGRTWKGGAFIVRKCYTLVGLSVARIVDDWRPMRLRGLHRFPGQGLRAGFWYAGFCCRASRGVKGWGEIGWVSGWSGRKYGI